MSFFSNLAKKLSFERKDSAAYGIHFNPRQPVWSSNTYEAFAREGYKQNVVAHQAISRLASAIATIPWEAYQDDKKLPGHPVLDIMRRPNPSQSASEFWRAKISYLYLHGNCFDERIMQGTKLLELWTLRPDRMTIIPGETGIASSYIYKVGSKSVAYPTDIHTGDGDINHNLLFNPVDDMYGLSPMTAGAYAVDQHNEAMRWIQGLLQNSARPSGALTIDADTGLSDQQFQRLKKEIEEMYSGGANAGRPLLLEGGMKWAAMGMSPDDMTIIDIKDSAARDISLAFGVPPLLLNIPGDTTYANYREARLGFYEDTVIPLAWFIIDPMNRWLAKSLKGAEIRPNIEAIEAIAEKKRGLWEMVDTADEITVNEARALKGFSHLTDAKIGEMLMADLRSSSRGHDEKKSGKDKPTTKGAPDDAAV
jgi:HK97 family phage portal protein